MIRRLRFDPEREDGGPDIVMAARLMGTVPNPAYYPDAVSLGAYLTDPTVSVFLDDETEQLVILTFLEKRREVRLSQGLPIPAKINSVGGKPVVSLATTVAATASLTALRAVARAAELDMLAKHLEARNWRYWGKFQITNANGDTVTSDGGEALCRGWKLYGYPDVHIGIGSDGQFSMWTTLAEATTSVLPGVTP
jgi:hypothetical protein